MSIIYYSNGEFQMSNLFKANWLASSPQFGRFRAREETSGPMKVQEGNVQPPEQAAVNSPGCRGLKIENLVTLDQVGS